MKYSVLLPIAVLAMASVQADDCDFGKHQAKFANYGHFWGAPEVSTSKFTTCKQQFGNSYVLDIGICQGNAPHQFLRNGCYSEAEGRYRLMDTPCGTANNICHNYDDQINSCYAYCT